MFDSYQVYIATSVETDELNHKVDSTSSYFLQRSLIAMSLCQQTPIILLDEPTSNLDIANQNKIMHLILNIQKQRSCIVIMTMHDLNLASQFCDRIVMLHNGKNFYEGTPEVIMTKENILMVYGTNVEVLNLNWQDSPVIVTRRDQHST